MTGDENAPEPTIPAARPAPPPVPSAPDAPVELTAAEQAVPDFDVPEPETGLNADAEAAIENFEVPPPPAFPSSVPDDQAASSEPAADDPEPPLRRRGTWAPNETWTSASAHKKESTARTAEKAASRAAASRAATARDEAARREIVSPAAGGTEGNSYRGWTVAIYGGLAVLFFGAIGFMAFLGLPG